MIDVWSLTGRTHAQNRMNSSLWLVTGGCGFIGTRLVAAVRDRLPDMALRVMDNLAVGTLEDLRSVAPVDADNADHGTIPGPRPGVVQFARGDIVDSDAMLRATRGADVVVHLAANTGVAPSVADPRFDCVSNVIGTLNALEAARHSGVRRFVFASSGAPVGEVAPPIHEEIAPHPVSPYGASKLAGEGYCSAYARTFGLETVVLRFGNVYGPGSKHKSSVVAQFIRDATVSGVLRINGDGGQTRDFIYVDDLVGAIVAAATHSAVGAGEVFQIATQRETSVAELAEIMSATLPRFGVPAPRLVYESPRLGDVRRNYSDTTKARERLGWCATTSVGDGIDKTIRWFLDSGRQHVRSK
jgi:UDP-glucose 4-epimerase